MFLSIIIPTFNRPAYLKQCLEPLAKQTRGLGDIEIRVVDDGSASDFARENAALCKSLEVHYERLKENKGASAARNVGIAASGGQWVAFLDDDVRVEDGWAERCVRALNALEPVVIGVEGKTVSAGSGLWDKEVENVTGGLYLSCHIFYRRETLRALGGFDEHFKSRYPSGEDHELAARVLGLGEIVFEPSLRVFHLPRAIHYGAYLKDSAYRMRTLLFGDLYFYCKHRDRYHMFRHAGSFWGTSKNIVLKHLWTSLRRRPLRRLLSHPRELSLLIASSLLEQLAAIMLLPLCWFKFKRNSRVFFKDHLDINKTANLWKLPQAFLLDSFRLSQNDFKSIIFPLTHRPVYSITPVMRKLSGLSGLPDMRIFLRVDDVFFDTVQETELLCNKMKEKNIPFCAAIPGDDLSRVSNSRLVRLVRDSGGEIALHGFTHRGKFGPFQSEILQLKIPQLEKMIEGVNRAAALSDAIKIFIPPFNALSREQIVFLSRYFKIISCGPEAGRFTDRFIGPVALPGGAWYFPAFHPFYNNAKNILKSKAIKELSEYKGFLCIGVHMSVEAKDGFEALLELIGRLSGKLTPWKYLFDF
jgi:glycosyltransferase involved in cell wall biosynthesis